MAYKRKTKDVWCIDTNWGSGWETESEYDKDDYENPRKSAIEDAKEYRLAGAQTRIVCRREKIDG